MTTTEEKIQKLASEADGYLRRDTERDILLPADNAPQWFTDGDPQLPGNGHAARDERGL
jgi:hypothetical protein